MSLDLNAIRERAERYARAMGPGGEKAWVAGLLAADVPALLAEVQRLTDSEDSRLVVLEAENKRLRDELGSARDWEAWERMQKRIAELEAMWASAKPVLDAAEEWFAAFEYEELDENYSAEERVLFNTIKANPSCPSCGPGGCAGHTRKPVAEDPGACQMTDCGKAAVGWGVCGVHLPDDHIPSEAFVSVDAELADQ